MIDRLLNSLVHYYYLLYFMICSFLNCFFLFLILKKTPNSLKQMKTFLFGSNFINFWLSSLSFFLQPRIVNNQKSLAVMGQGFCKYFGPGVCFNTYIFQNIFVLLSDRMNMQTLYFRMIAVKYFEIQIIRKKLLIFSSFYLALIIPLILTYIPPMDFDAVYKETLLMHSEYDFEPFAKFGGYADSHHICMNIINIVFLCFAFLEPTLGIYFKREAMKQLDKNIHSLSKRTIEQFRTLLHGLSIQIIVPFICYTPISFIYVYNKYSGSQIILSQYFVGISLTFPAVVDPIISIYFILPYRFFVKDLFQKYICRKKFVGNFTNHLNSTGDITSTKM